MGNTPSSSGNDSHGSETQSRIGRRRLSIISIGVAGPSPGGRKLSRTPYMLEISLQASGRVLRTLHAFAARRAVVLIARTVARAPPSEV